MQWRSRFGALLLGTIAGILLLEVGLALCTDVDRDWFPGQARLSLDQGKAFCFSSGLTVELPLDARRTKDRTLLIARTRQWFVTAPVANLERVLDLAPHCVIVNERVRERGPAPERKQVVPIFGDSFAFGHGLPQEHSVAAILAARDANNNFPTLARPGDSVAGVLKQVAQFQRLAWEHGWHATDALYLYNVDDLLAPEFPPPKLAELGRTERNAGDRGFASPPRTWDTLASHSRAYRVVRRYLDEIKTTLQTLEFYRLLYDDSIPDDGRRRSRAILKELTRTLGTGGVQLHIVLYPVLHVDKDGAYSLRGVHDTVMEWCVEDGLSCFDGAAAVLGNGNIEKLILHPQDRHPNDAANGRMATFILNKVLVKAVSNGG